MRKIEDFFKTVFWIAAGFRGMMPLYSETFDHNDATALEVFRFTMSCPREELVRAVWNAYGEEQGEYVFIEDFRRFLPAGALITSKFGNHEQVVRGLNGEEKRWVCINFTYRGRDFAYKFFVKQSSPQAPAVFEDVYLYPKPRN